MNCNNEQGARYPKGPPCDTHMVVVTNGCLNGLKAHLRGGKLYLNQSVLASEVMDIRKKPTVTTLLNQHNLKTISLYTEVQLPLLSNEASPYIKRIPSQKTTTGLNIGIKDHGEPDPKRNIYIRAPAPITQENLCRKGTE